MVARGTFFSVSLLMRQTWILCGDAFNAVRCSFFNNIFWGLLLSGAASFYSVHVMLIQPQSQAFV